MRRHWYEVSKLCFALCCMAFFLNCSEVEIEHNEENVDVYKRQIGGLEAYKEFIHFGLTSQDINNTSVPLSIKEALEECYYPQMEELIAQLRAYAEEWNDVSMFCLLYTSRAIEVWCTIAKTKGW